MHQPRSGVHQLAQGGCNGCEAACNSRKAACISLRSERATAAQQPRASGIGVKDF